jgi:hypothetical protein
MAYIRYILADILVYFKITKYLNILFLSLIVIKNHLMLNTLEFHKTSVIKKSIQIKQKNLNIY